MQFKESLSADNFQEELANSIDIDVEQKAQELLRLNSQKDNRQVIQIRENLS
jgi:hypothetical protein